MFIKKKKIKIKKKNRNVGGGALSGASFENIKT